jgi:hypothetical protein
MVTDLKTMAKKAKEKAAHERRKQKKQEEKDARAVGEGKRRVERDELDQGPSKKKAKRVCFCYLIQPVLPKSF